MATGPAIQPGRGDAAGQHEVDAARVLAGCAPHVLAGLLGELARTGVDLAADVLVHPSLHDSGGFVLLEAMEMRKPVVCLKLGGPGVYVNEHTGYAIPATSIPQVIDDLATADLDFLIDAITLFTQSKEGERALRGGSIPERSRVKTWIEAALHICENRSAA